MTHPLVSWAVAAMTSVQPVAVTPWASTYEASATTIVKVSEEHPFFAGSEGVRRTVAMYLGLGWFESRFDPKAKGDCTKKDNNGQCLSSPASLCFFQVGRSNFKALGITEESILGDFEVCARAAQKMIAISFNVCRGRPELELLGNFASGRGTCGGIRESEHRMRKANYIFRTFPFRGD